MASQFFGSCYARYRKKQDFAQKHPQLWAKQLNLKLHDSQIAYFEIKPTFQPNVDFFVNLGFFNEALATNKMPPANDTFTNTVREKLLNAEPFLNNNNEPATATDFWEMRAGIQNIPEQYVTTTINDKLALQYTKLLREEFHNTRRELMVSGKELVQMLIKTEVGQKVKEKDIDVLKDVLTEEFDFTGKHLTYLMSEYGTLPCFSSINEVKPNLKMEKFCKDIGIK